MPKKQQRQNKLNSDWEAELAAYDKSCEDREREFRSHFMVIDGSGHKSLSEDENEVLKLILNGLSCVEIAKQAEVDPEEVEALVEIIRVKLTLKE